MLPLVAHRLGWYAVVTAEHLRRDDVSDEVRKRSQKVAAESAAAIDPEARPYFGITICEVVPHGQRFIVEVEDEHRPDGRTEVVGLHSAGGTAFYSEPDVEAASVLSGRAVEVVRAVDYVSEGRQPRPPPPPAGPARSRTRPQRRPRACHRAPAPSDKTRAKKHRAKRCSPTCSTPWSTR